MKKFFNFGSKDDNNNKNDSGKSNINIENDIRLPPGDEKLSKQALLDQKKNAEKIFDENIRIVHISAFLGFLFLSMIIYFTYFVLFKSEEAEKAPYNSRKLVEEQKIERGKFLDRNGEVLASSYWNEKNKQIREYPYKNLYSHVIGYNSRAYGKSSLEYLYNKELLNMVDFNLTDFNMEQWRNKLLVKEKKGNDITLTINHKMQEFANSQLKNSNGSIVVMDPRNGEILAMVSKPDFDVNDSALNQNWKELISATNFPFLNRTTSSKYAPGSTFKTLISALAYENKLENFTVEDKATITIDGYKIKNHDGKASKEEGSKVDIKTALCQSSNVYFSQLGLKIGADPIQNIATRVGFNKKFDLDFPLTQSSLNYPDKMNKTDIAAVSIGQGKISLTPMHLAMITSAIANDGKIMKPHIVKKINYANGDLRKETKSEILLDNVMTKTVADKVSSLMYEVVKTGTGNKASLPAPLNSIKVAGKTGTAENETSKTHAWFISFAPVEKPEIAIVVMREFSGDTGGTTCAPISREIMLRYFSGIFK